MSAIKPFYDVVIVGAGPVGGLLACALSRSSYLGNVLLLEKSKPRYTFDSAPDQRVYSINSSSLKLLQSLKLPVNEQRIGVLNAIKVWNDDGMVEFNEPLMSKVIENNNILQALDDARQQTSNIQYLPGREIKGFEVRSKRVNIVMDDGQQFFTKLLVGSDGNRSMVKETSKINTYGWSYNQMGIVCTLKLDRSITTAYQRYRDGNVLAILPLWENYASIVWSVETPFA